MRTTDSLNIKMDYYDTGLIDSKQVQDEFGRDRVGAIMDRLKQKLFSDYRTPHVQHDQFSAYEKICLKAMEGIDLVRNEAKGYRLTQACDVTDVEPDSLAEQTKQKNNLECGELVRGTSAEERDHFQLGTGETFADSTSEHVSKITSSWWSCENDPIGGYGDYTDVTTDARDLFALGDVDVQHVYQHTKNSTFANIDNAYHWNQELFNVVYNSVIDEDNVEDSYQTYGELHNKIVENDTDFIYPESMIIYVKEAAEENGIPLKKEIDMESINALEAELHTAAGALKYIKELNVVYHPWATVAEIQKHRKYDPPIDEGQRTLDAWLRGRRGQKRKREYYRLKF
jgi:hypothetical protein